MGNWRTVDMVGHIDKNDVQDIRRFLAPDSDSGDAWCFTMDLSLCGLNNWVSDSGIINISANLHERDITNDDIEKALNVLAKRYKSLSLTLHSGSDWESTVCSASFYVENGIVTRCNPQVERIRDGQCLTLQKYFAIEAAYERNGNRYV